MSILARYNDTTIVNDDGLEVEPRPRTITTDNTTYRWDRLRHPRELPEKQIEKPAVSGHSFGFLTVAGSGSVAFGDLLVAPRKVTNLVSRL